MSSIWDKYVANPIWKLANYWNNNLWYGEDAQKGNMSFADRFANLTLWNIINWLDTYANAESRILNTTESWWRALYDKVVKGYDTDWDFYDKDREEHIVDEVIDAVYGAWQSAMWWFWLLPWALPATSFLSTVPWEILGGITLGSLSKAIDWTLDNVPLVKQAYNMLSEDSRDKLSTGVAMAIVWREAKRGKAKLDAKAEPYITTAKGMLESWLKKAWEYAQVQRGFEEFQWTKEVPFVDMETWEVGTVSEFEWFKPWYRWRIAKEAWEWFKEGIRERMNTEWTTLSEWESTVYQEWIPWREQTSWVSEGVKTDTNGTQTNWIVNRIWTAQLRQWNKMNKSQAIKFSNKYGTDYGNWLAQRWFNQAYENNINALIDYADYTQWQKSQVLWTITQRYRDPAIDDMLTDALEKAEYIKSPDLWKLESLALKNEQGGLTLQDADWLRQWFWYNFPLRFDGTDVSGTVARNNNMYTAMREFLEAKAAENWFPQLRELNREIAATHHSIEATTRRYNGIATNDTVSLKDLVTLAWAMANPNAWPLFMLQQALKSTKVQDRILSKLIKWKTNSERNQIKIDLEKIKKIQDAAEQRRLLEEWIAKWNLKVEQATIWVDKILPENIVTDPTSGNWWGIEATDTFTMPEPVKAPGEIGVVETYSPKVLLKAMIEQLEVMNLIEKVNSSAIADYILKNLSPEAQQRLGEIAQKLSKGRMLTEEDSQVVQKLADVIRHQQDWLKGLDNGEPTGYNPTDLPTNPTNNGGITDGYNPWGEAPNDWGNWNTGIRPGEGNWLWESKGGIGKQDGTDSTWTRRITDKEEYWNIFKSIMWFDAYLDWFENQKSFTNADNTALISIDNNWNIVEFVRPDWVEADFWKELMFKAISEWGNKITAPDYNWVRYMEKYWFTPVARWIMNGRRKYWMVHNWDPIETVIEKYWKYEHKRDIEQAKDMEYWEAKKYMNDMIKDTVWYEIKDEKWRDWAKNWREFNNKFKTNQEIRDYVLKNFKEVTNEADTATEEAYNRELAETKEIINWHVDMSDISVWYFKNLKAFQKADNVGRRTNALFSRRNVRIDMWVSEWYSVSHETWHWLDYKAWKELVWQDVLLSSIADRIIELGLERPEKVDTKAVELIWDFVDIFREAKKWWYNWYKTSHPNWRESWLDRKYVNRPTERFARLWEAFTKAVRWESPNNNKWEQFTKKLAVDISKWLGKMDIARQNWELFDWTLTPIDDVINVTLEIPWIWRITWLKQFVKGDWTINYDSEMELEERWRHWSAAKFDKFDSSHMGEGEWAQAHWWGHYIAMEERTWKHYASMWQNGYEYNGTSLEKYRSDHQYTPFDQRDANSIAEEMVLNDRRLNWNVDIDELKEEVRVAIHNNNIEWVVNKYKEVLEALDKIDLDKVKEIPWHHIYEVEIPDPIKKDTPTWSNYLEEDYTLNQKETNKLADAIDKYVNENNGNFKYTHANSQWRFDNGKIDRATLNDNTAFHLKREADILRNAWMIKWKNLVMDLQNLLGDKWASKFLESLGYDWIHYFWRQDGEAYVIFNDDAIDIVNHKAL